MFAKKSKGLTVVVADRAHAHVYETPRLGGDLVRVATLGNPNARRHERDLMTYAPGRMFNRSSGAHQTFTPHETARQHDAAQFARVVGKTVQLSLKSNKCDGVVLVAAPRMLSEIRRSLPKSAMSRVVCEIPKDLVHQPKRVLIDHIRSR